MKKDSKIDQSIIVTKENLSESLKLFNKALNSNLFKFVVINNDISTTNKKYIENNGEIVFTEFTLCKKVNAQAHDIEFKMDTFLIPSLKFHRYSPDEIISFSPIFMKYLANEKFSYNFNNINKGISLSYENINKKEKLEKSLKLILFDGKPFKKENHTSYYYYPKAFELPSKKYQKRFEEILNYFVSQILDENAKKIKNDEKSTNFSFQSEIYEKNFKLLNNILDFRWNQIFKSTKNEAGYKLFVDELKIKLIDENNILINEEFLNFLKELKNYFENKNNEASFEINFNDQEFNSEFFENWKKYLFTEGVLDFNFSKNENQKFKFNIEADKSITDIKHDSYLNLKNINGFLDALIKILNKENNEKEFLSQQIPYRRINMKPLLPSSLQKFIEIFYHLSPKIEESLYEEIDKKNKKKITDTINYRKLYIKGNNDEEILFGHPLYPTLKKFFMSLEFVEKKRDTRTIGLEIGNDLKMLYNEDEIKNIFNEFFSSFNFEVEAQNNYIKIDYTCNKSIEEPNRGNDKDNIKQKKEKIIDDFLIRLIKEAKNVKQRSLINEELGVTLFYDALFKKKDANIYGTNLKNKIIFPIKKLLIKDENDEKLIKEIIDNVNIYDISYICRENNIDFFKKYLELKNDKEKNVDYITQRLTYIIQECKKEEKQILLDEEILEKYKNKFYSDQINKEHSIFIDKKKFYENVEEIIKKIQEYTDFTVNIDSNNNEKVEINVIDRGTFEKIEEIKKVIEGIISK